MEASAMALSADNTASRETSISKTNGVFRLRVRDESRSESSIEAGGKINQMIAISQLNAFISIFSRGDNRQVSTQI
jgi:hypothetical protein